MARARNIKPGLFKNELLVEQSLFVRLLFVGLWTLADREGRLEDRPKRIRLELFPYDNDDVDSALNILVENGFIVRYQAAGFNVIHIVNFLKHQTPHGTEKDSMLPGQDGEFNVNLRNKFGYVTGSKRHNNVKYEDNNVHLQDNNKCTPVSERPDSLNPDSLNTTTNVVVKEKKPRKVVCSLPEVFYPDETGVALANEFSVSIQKELPNFCDYYKSKGETRADWQASWRTWVRNAAKFSGKQINGFKSEKQRNSEATMRAIYGTPIQQDEKLIQGEIV